MLMRDVAALGPLCWMWEGCESASGVDPPSGRLTLKATREWAHPGFFFLPIIKEKLIKVKGKKTSDRSCSRKCKNVLWILVLTFVFQTHISFPLCNAGWERICGVLRIFLSVWVCVCVCVLFYVYYFYSRLVYSFSAYRKCYDPMNQKVPLTVRLLPSWKTNPTPWNMPPDDPWTSAGFSSGSVVSGQGSQLIMLSLIIPPTKHLQQGSYWTQSFRICSFITRQHKQG